MSLPSSIELPFGIPGKVYRSQMPFSARDPEGKNFERFQEFGIGVIVVLAGTDECLKRSGRDLPAFYSQRGFEVIHLPIEYFGVPQQAELRQAVDEALAHAWKGKNIVVHCLAGYGRTGTFLACMARRVFQMTPQAAILWVRGYIPGAIEVAEQVQIVEEFE